MINKIDDNKGYYYNNQIPSSRSISIKAKASYEYPVQSTHKITSAKPKEDILELSNAYKAYEAYVLKSDRPRTKSSVLPSEQNNTNLSSSENIFLSKNNKDTELSHDKGLTGYQKQGIQIYIQQAQYGNPEKQNENAMGIA